MLKTSKGEQACTRASPSIQVVMALSFGIFLLILAAYIGLIPLGHWQGDEFYIFPKYTGGGWKALLSRMISWSPRPFSELLIFAYAHLVEFYQSPLIAVALAPLWLMLSLSLLAVPIVARQAFPSAMSRSQGLLLSLGLYCLMLVGHPVDEVFYWTWGAVDYIPVIAGVCAAMWIFIVSGTKNMRGRWVISVMLIVTALSEVSALLVVVFCLLLVFQVLMDKLGRKPTVLTDRGVLWLAIPFVAAATVLIAFLFGRFEAPNEIYGDRNIAHHLIPALSHAASTFLRNLLSVPGVTLTPMRLVLELATRTLFFMAAYSILRPVALSRTSAGTDRRLLGLLSLACFATMFLCLAAFFYQMGCVACERYHTFLHILIYLGILSSAAFAAGRTKLSSADSAIGPATTRSIIFLIASVLIPASISAPGIAYEYRNYGTYLEVNRQNCSAGLAPADRMVYRLLPNGKIIGSLNNRPRDVPNGTYTLTDDSGWVIHAIIRYFKKRTITFENTPLAAEPINRSPVAILAPLQQHHSSHWPITE